MNVARKQVGITYTGSEGRTSLLYFSKVPFGVGNWFQLTLLFRGFQKRKPVVELYVNDIKVNEKTLTRNFKDAIEKTNKEKISIALADMWGLTDNVALMPRVSCQT